MTMVDQLNFTYWDYINFNLTLFNFSHNLSTLHLGEEDAFEGFYLRAQFITGLFCYPVICLFGLTGNTLSIIVLSRSKRGISSTNVYLIALAVSDSIKLLNDSFYFMVILLLNVDPAVGNNAYGALYPYAHYFFNVSVCITAWLTVSVAAERYIMVCHATKARTMCNVRRARLVTAIVFVTMGILTIPSALRYRTVEIRDQETGTVQLDVEVTNLWKNDLFVLIYTWQHNLLRSIVPLLLLCMLNCFIVNALKRTRTIKKRVNARHRITMMLVAVIVVFLLCITPDAIMSTFFGYGYQEANYLARGVREITDLLLTVNSAINFILYCTFNQTFRSNFIAIFCGRCARIRGATVELGVIDGNVVTGRSSMATFRGAKEDITICRNKRDSKDLLPCRTSYERILAVTSEPLEVTSV